MVVRKLANKIKKLSISKTMLLVILCTLFTSTGQILFKVGSKHIVDFYSIITNIPLFFGLVSYGLGAVLLVVALMSADLSLVYPFISLSFVWVNIASIFLFSEAVSLINWVGIFIIIIGVSLIGWSSR